MAAVDEETVDEALKLIDVKYEVLPAVFDMEEAMKPGAPMIHDAMNNIAVILPVNDGLAWTVIFFPVVILPLLIATLGAAWFLASLGVFVRDVGQTVGIFTTVMMFLSPVFYPISALPEKFQFWLMLNPLTFVIEQSRTVIIFGKLPDWTGLGVYTAVSLIVAWAGFWWFQKTRKGFADVLWPIASSCRRVLNAGNRRGARGAIYLRCLKRNYS